MSYFVSDRVSSFPISSRVRCLVGAHRYRSSNLLSPEAEYREMNNPGRLFLPFIKENLAAADTHYDIDIYCRSLGLRRSKTALIDIF